ncbi:hypothetical protein A0H81_01975 [Grifola frondosa]|uniref:Uncharacterized protein n=1 Tax=Grifola frondosa TaxID=5627 RepID=A0A1C7MRB9_GRIFR|nr:hypothetical protein A0H81_01975 [Grifola frondosa]
MSTAIQYPPYSSRLPSYRSGHTERYHPYPRPSRSRETRLMNTVDYRYVDLPTWGSPPCTVRLRPVFSCVDSDVSTVDLGRTSPAASDLIGGDHYAEGRSKHSFLR